MEQAYLPGTVRQRIQELIKERKITQAELAAEIGMAESSLSRFLSEKTDKIGDEYIIKIADFLGVSTDFILGQTDFPERRNYDIEELGLSYKTAMALYTREVDTDVVNRILENPQFPEITRMISRYFKDAIAEGFAVQNAMWSTLQQLTGTVDTSHLTNPQEGAEAAMQILGMMKTAPHEKDIESIQFALMTKLYNQGTMTFYAHENVENLGVYIFSCSFTRALICGKIIINDVVSVQPQKEIEMKTTDINKVRYTNRWRIVYGICNN